MSRMMELIRQSAVPANVMRAAAKGALALPPAEMIEILVHLTGNPVFSEQARMTLAGWDEVSSLAAAADPQTPQSVLDYFLKPENLRPRLVPALLENASVLEGQLLELAQTGSREIISMMLASPRVRSSGNLLHALEGNELLDDRDERLRQALDQVSAHQEQVQAPEEPEGRSQYEIDHAAEIAAEEGKPFTLTGDILDLGFGDESAESISRSGPPIVLVLPELEKKAAEASADPKIKERFSTLQKIARMTVGERVQLAMKGSRDERFILIRDGAKVVASAVLESPKLSENEVEVFASMKNVQETVLRTIATKRRFMKVYAVVRALANNPRTPIDTGLPLMNHLLINDLKHLSTNKNVSDTIRKLALKLYRQKVSPDGRMH